MSKSSANPRRYSKGRQGLDPTEPLVVYVEIRVERPDINGLDTRLRYLNSRRPNAVLGVAGVRRESSKFVVTLGIDFGPMREALRGTSLRTRHGYDLLWDIWEQMVEFNPVFASPPGPVDQQAARSMFAADTIPSLSTDDDENSYLFV